MRLGLCFDLSDVHLMTSGKAPDICTVSLQEWIIDERVLGDAPRKERLLDVPTATDLIAAVSDAAKHAAGASTIGLLLVQCGDEPEFFRFEAKIPVPEPLFDVLFNGRSGYRAQYYVSPEQGASFNRMLVNSLAPAVMEACRCKLFKDLHADIKQSLSGQHSKVWVVGDGTAFLDSPAALKPARWAQYWTGNDNAFGLRLPCPLAPQIDLKGTFVKPGTKEEWLYEGKKNRSRDIHETGWT